jgi:hypothetical protein
VHVIGVYAAATGFSGRGELTPDNVMLRLTSQSTLADVQPSQRRKASPVERRLTGEAFRRWPDCDVPLPSQSIIHWCQCSHAPGEQVIGLILDVI